MKTIDIGILLSTEGTYSHMANSALAGTLHALAEINADPTYPFQIQARHINPAGDLAAYGEAVCSFIDQGIRHIFGTITSASRKEIIPDLEQHNLLLWYGSPYEGFESCEQVVYLGGCPNQTLLPLLRLALETFGTRAWLAGSNYVWGWESNRIAREVVEASGGAVVGEKYLHLRNRGVAELVEAILSAEVDFVLNNLVGESAYAFLRALDEACIQERRTLAVLSCNFTEAEVAEVAPLRAVRLLSCGPFFESVDPDFCARQRLQHGARRISHYYIGAWRAVRLFADSLRQAGDSRPDAVLAALHRQYDARSPGALAVLAQNNHACLPCYIAELQQTHFQILHRESQPVMPDPYLSATDLRQGRTVSARPDLRIVK
ncbi:transporter substrate-binding protein [Klebsiella sp. WOUb02]|uniref:transporter substrate-binding protein n=1 Tax=Klebsiella sp. WOUb02 TaxID=3161071 RepID=UPI003CF6CD4D